MRREHTVAPADNKTAIVRNDGSNLSSFVSFNEGIELTTVLAYYNISALSADNETSSVLHPSMTDDAMSTFSALKLRAHIIELTVINCKISFTDLIVLVGAGTGHNNGIRVKGVEGDLESWEALRVRESDAGHCLDL